MLISKTHETKETLNQPQSYPESSASVAQYKLQLMISKACFISSLVKMWGEKENSSILHCMCMALQIYSFLN